MTDILFGQSYYLRFDPKLWAAMQPYPPLGTMIAAACVRQQGYDVALFDAMLADSPAEWAAALDKHCPRIAVIYEDNFNYLSKMCLLNMRQAAFQMLALAKQRGCLTIVCGSDAADHYPLYLQNGADFVILGEGEETLTELLAEIGDWKPETAPSPPPLTPSPPHPLTPSPPHSPIPSLAWRAPNGPVATPRRPPLRDVDSLPFPAWDLIDVEKYRRIWLARHGYFSMNMVTTRGCPYHCNW
ncbi:MAG TPA: radical SAM protein, partial [Anaerolineae bacterium]|nr:radical SAM protein [Anaerolineae bacterium]